MTHPPDPEKRIRLVKVIVQPVVVVDDGDQLHPIEVKPIEVAGADWPRFSSETWPQIVAARQEAMNAMEETTSA